MKRSILALAAIAAIAFASPAAAQAPPQAPPIASINGYLSFSVTSSSSQQALAADSGAFPAITFYNRGTKDAYFKFGPNSSVAATTTPTGVAAGKIPAGTRLTVWAGSGNKNLALITAGSDTTTVEAYQSTGPMDFGLLGGSGGGAVTSVFSRTGDVVAAPGDYTCAQVTNAACLNSVNTFAGASVVSTPAVLYSGAIFTGGNGITTMPFMLLQPSAASAVTTWSSSGTVIGINSNSAFAGFFVDFRKNASAQLFAVDTLGNVTVAGQVNASNTISAPSLNLSVTGSMAFGGRGSLSSGAPGNIQLGLVDSSTAAVAQTLSAQSVNFGNNLAGQTMTVVGSLSTGSGVSGDIVFKTGGTGAAISTQNAAVAALTIKGATQTVQIASGKALQLGNTFAASAPTATGSLLLTDAAGNVYKIPACLASGC